MIPIASSIVEYSFSLGVCVRGGGRVAKTSTSNIEILESVNHLFKLLKICYFIKIKKEN